MLRSRSLAVGLLYAALAAAQTFIPPPKGVTTLQSRNYPDISLSYKQTSICETTRGVKAYSGYVTLPSEDKTYNASIFFWYFESRHNAAHAPTTIYLPGGPGTSFLDGAGGFPCLVEDHANATTLNPWSWNNEVNMLYLDVPTLTGFSYTNALNGTFDLISQTFTPLQSPDQPIATNLTTVAATMPLQDARYTTNTTGQVARQVWQIAQVWFQEFPGYRTTNKEINFWGFSYSGFFTPATAAHFLKQNEKIAKGTINDPHAKAFAIGTLGLNNGCVDSLAQAASYPEMAINNTYGVQLVSQEIYEVAKANVTKPGGCYDLIQQCRQIQAELDPEQTGSIDDVNWACLAATQMCYQWIQGALTSNTTRSPYDMALQLPGIFPSEIPASFFNQRWVQEELGVPVNFTLNANPIAQAYFASTGDPMIPSLSTLEYLVTSGVNLALVYGDRDFRCNWMSVENVSLSLSYPSAEKFRSAGYANIETSGYHVGGVVRQHGNVSFSRVFEAGHTVGAYQPEAVYQIFSRAISGRDVATGRTKIAKGAEYSTKGPLSSFGIKNVLPDSPPSVCYLFEPVLTCTDEQLSALEDGTAVVKDSIVVFPPSKGAK